MVKEIVLNINTVIEDDVYLDTQVLVHNSLENMEKKLFSEYFLLKALITASLTK